RAILDIPPFPTRRSSDLLVPQFNESELPLLMEVQNYAPQMGFRYEVSPVPETFLSPGDVITLGQHQLTCLFAPGHSPGHLCFYSEAQGFRSEEHTSELQSRENLVCRLLLEKK